MKLTARLYNRVMGKRFYRLVRWMPLGEFHLLDTRVSPTPKAICGELIGIAPEEFVRGERAQICDDCYALLLVQSRSS